MKQGLMGKLLILVITSVIGSVGFADTCPTVRAIKTQTLKGWQFYDSDNGILLSAKQKLVFIKNAEAFVLAEWTRSHSGSIHCYYRNQSGAALEFYLAKSHFVPLDSQQFWYQVSGAMHCAAGMDRCQFKPTETA